MPNFKSDLITANDQIAVSNKMVNGDRTGGLLLGFKALYTLVGTEAANDTIQVIDLPAGATLDPENLKVTCADPGTTLTMDIGDSANPDRYADGITLSNGGQIAATSGTMPEAVATPYVTTAKSRVYATVASAATLTAGVVLVFSGTYRIKG